jgi:Leucine-rich repeat (LRR) protein
MEGEKDLQLIIRHAKRGNSKEINLSNMGLSALPNELLQLRQLESLNLSGNKISTISGIGALTTL